MLDTGNGAVLFCPPSTANPAPACQIVADNIGSSGNGGFVRSDGAGNYIVAIGQANGMLDGMDQTQIYTFPACNPATKVCPATVTAPTGLLSYSDEGEPDGTIPGDAFGLAVAGGIYYVSVGNEPEFYFTYPIVAVNPAGLNGQLVSTFFANNLTSQGAPSLFEPSGLVFDSQTGNLLVGDPDIGLSAISPDGTGVGYVNPSGGIAAFVLKQDVPVGPALTLTGGALPAAVPGQPYSATISASGGTPPLVYSASGLPSGITLNQATGVFSGTTTQTGTFTVSVLVAELTNGSVNATATFTLTVSAPAPPPPLTLSGSLPQGAASEPYSAGFSASGGVPPYTYSASGLPSGFSINANNGSVSGQSTQTGTFTVSVSVTDSTGATAGGSFTLTITPPPPVTLSGANFGSVVVGTPVSTTISASGGVPPYTYALAGGAPPSGLNLLSSGTLRGTPLAAGSYSFSVKVTDSSGGTATGSFTFTILPPPLTINVPSPLATGVVTIGYPTQTITATGGTKPYTFAVTTGSLPAGLALSSTGMITGTPTAATASAGTTFTVTATDSAATPSTGTANLSITVQPFTENILLSSGSLAFALDAGTSNLPPSQTVGVQSTMVNQPANYTVAVQPASATWLSGGSGGTTPGTLSISLTQAALSLAASTTPYTANVVVTCTSTACSGNTQTVPVSLTVSSPPPVLSVQATALSFNTTSANPQTTTETSISPIRVAAGSALHRLRAARRGVR